MLYLLPLLLLQAATTQTPPLTPASKSAPSVSKWPARDAQFTVRDFRLRSGETMPELRINYTTLGSPHTTGLSVASSGTPSGGSPIVA